MLTALPEQPLSAGYLGVREHAAWIDFDPLQYLLKISGEEALELLNQRLPGKLFYLPSYRAITTAVLDRELRIIDLLVIMHLDDGYLAIGSTSAKSRVLEHLKPEGFQATVEDLGGALSLLGLEGPYAWQQARQAFGNEVLGLGIASVLEVRGRGTGKILCLRNGYSGEYAYQLICQRSDKEQVLAQLRGKEGLPQLQLPDLILAALETRSPLFGATVNEGDCPLEADLRYMIDFFKEEALDLGPLRALSERPGKALVAFLAKAPIAQASAVLLEGQEVGQVRLASYSPKLGAYCGYALMEPGWAYPGGNDQGVSLMAGACPIVTRSSPLYAPLSASVTIGET